MRRTTIGVLLGLLLVVGAVARADEETLDDSPAAKAYQAGFWAETGSGRLDEALAHYDEALRVEGPPAVKAHALLRRGIVLERLGRTEEAIRALERLAKEYASETALLVEARERLEAWTAQDLRTSFAEWYERYRYSPEFQAHVVDLVLKLSAEKDTDECVAAMQELLTIGAPAVPALRAHLDSSNDALRERVVSLLLQLGEVPPAAALVGSRHWVDERGAWATLLALPEASRAALRAALPTDRRVGAVLDAALQGPADLPAALDRWGLTALLSAALDRFGDQLAEPLRAMVRSEAPAGGYQRDHLAQSLREHGLVPDELALDWLRTAPADVRVQVAKWVRGAVLHDPRAWEALTAWLAQLEPGSRDAPQALVALVAACEDAPADADFTPLVAAIERHALRSQGAGFGLNPTGRFGPGWLRVLGAIVEQAREARLVQQALGTWVWGRRQAGAAGIARRLLAWAEAPLRDQLRTYALRLAGENADAGTLDAVLEALEAIPDVETGWLLQGLRNHKGLTALPWTGERVRSLLRSIRAKEGAGVVQAEARSLFGTLLRDGAVRDLVLDVAFEDPTLLPGRFHLVGELPKEVQQDPEQRSRFATRFREACTTRWTVVQQAAAFGAMASLWSPVKSGDDMEGFLRERLRADRGEGEVAAQLTWSIVTRLPAPTLDDLRAAFDLTDPESAARALHVNAPRTAEVYDALSALKAHPNAPVRRDFFGTWLHPSVRATLKDEAFVARIHRDQAADPDPGLRRAGVLGMHELGRSDAVPLLVKALADVDATVRTAAAAALGTLYDKDAIQALARVLDDEVPAVRAAALASLEAIQKVEEQKAYWKKFAEEKR